MLVGALSIGNSACSSNQERDPDLNLDQQRQLAGPQVGKWLVDAQQALRMGSYSRALSLTDSAQKHAPGLADAPFLRGRILTEMNRLEEAEASYRRVLELDSVYRGAWLNLGNVAYGTGKPRTSLERYQRELLNYPSPELFILIGQAYDELNRPDSARLAYEQAIEHDSSFALAYGRLAQLHSRSGALDLALSHGRQAVQLKPDNQHFRFILGHVLLQSGEATEAVSLLKPVADELRWHRAAHYDLARALNLLGRSQEAEEYAAWADSLRQLDDRIEFMVHQTNIDPQNADSWAGLAELFHLAGRTGEALGAYLKALHLAPNRMDWQYHAANLALELGHVRQAIAQYQRILEWEPSLTDVWVNLGIAYDRAGQSDLAGKAWREALERNPDHEGARALLER